MATDKVSKEQIRKIAELCNLDPTEAETAKLADMFSEALEAFEQLKELDTDSVGETYQVTGLTNVFQKKGGDGATLDQKDALSNGKEVERGLFVTEAVFDR